MTDTTVTPESDETPEETRCTLCGWVIEDLDLATMTKTGIVHFDRQCPKGEAKPEKKTRARKSPERKLAEGAGIVVKEMKVVGVRGAHAECDHEATKSARAACRKRRAAGE